jgi:hypothetical protein
VTIQIGDGSANPVFTDVVQQIQSLGALNAQNQAQLRGQANATVQVTGIGSLTLVFEATTDGSNFDALSAYPVAGGAAITSTTANGHWFVPTAGFYQFRVRVSAYTSGSATVSVVASQGTQIPPVSTAGNAREDLVAWAGTALGTPTNFGTTPTAVIAGSVNSSVFVGTTAAVAASAGVQKVGISGATGVTLDAATGAGVPANGLLVGGGSVAGGTNLTALTVKAASTAAAATDTSLVVQSLVNSHTMNTAAAGTQLVGIVGNAAAVLDSVTTAATTPANAFAVSVANVTTAPSLTTGQSVALQGDYQGSVFVKPYRRGQTAGKSTTISGTTATAIVTAPGAGIFADLAGLYITVTPQATTGEAFTISISDGTNTYVFDMFTGITATVAPTSIQLNFDPPIPATSTATAWNATVSTITTQPTIHVTTVAVLQKAS